MMRSGFSVHVGAIGHELVDEVVELSVLHRPGIAEVHVFVCPSEGGLRTLVLYAFRDDAAETA